ncbi:MAG: glucose-1-phosphate cytidylyltransferase [Nitrospiraceae bacterium]
MKAIILAGGLGTRLSEETHLRPKPMVEVGGKPILWHIMKIYAAQGIKEFIIALGYKSEIIKEYFINFYAFNSDISVDLGTGKTTLHNAARAEDWTVHLVETGLHTQTGGRLKRLKKWLGDDETFLFTYGDGVADVDVQASIAFHKQHGKLATVTTVLPPARFGRLQFEQDRITEFKEKPHGEEGWINGGFYVLQKEVIDYVAGDETAWEREPLQRLTQNGQLMGFRHERFWSCMDTLREKNSLDELWASGKAPWKLW